MDTVKPKSVQPYELVSGQLGLTCRTCDQPLPLTMFSKSTRAKCGYDTMCKECQRFRMKKKNYGISRSSYEHLREKQQACCAICGAHETSERCLHNHLVVDHCHATGEIRGLLCHLCNQVLGLIKEDQATLLTMADYLGRRKS